MLNLLVEPLSDFTTLRACSVCLNRAAFATYRADAAGDFDRSSKQFRCSEHKETVTPDWKKSVQRISAKVLQELLTASPYGSTITLE